MSAQSLQMASAKAEPRAHKRAHKSQMSAQSRQRLAHVVCPESAELIQEVAHFSHSVMQARQALIHASLFILFNFLMMPKLAYQS